MDLKTFVIGMSPPVTMQHRRLLCLKCKSKFKTVAEVYLIRQLIKKLQECYDAEGFKVPLTQCAELPKIMLQQEVANSIVTDTIFDSSITASEKIV